VDPGPEAHLDNGLVFAPAVVSDSSNTLHLVWNFQGTPSEISIKTARTAEPRGRRGSGSPGRTLTLASGHRR